MDLTGGGVRALFIYVVFIIVMILLGSSVTIDMQDFNLEKFSKSRFQLIWHEEFNTDKIDESVWNFNIGDGCPDLCGWGNAELQYYRRENAFIENGNLVIEARKERFTNPMTGTVYEYTSARLDTIGKLAITPPARIEIKAKLPLGKGLWPAIWMLGEEWSLQNVKAWPECGEIDIIELIGSEPDIVHGTVHAPFCYGARGVGSWFRLPAGKDFSQDYHVFAIEWTEDYIAWFVDDQLYHIVSKREFQRRGCIWVFDKPFHIVVNIAVGGYWPGKPDETTPFPARLWIEYIKVYRVLEPNQILSQIDNSDNELLAKSRGWPKVSFEKIVNGDFERLVNKDNNPLINPDDWFLSGELSIIESLTIEDGVLTLVLKNELGRNVSIGLSQLVWIRQNVEYELRMKAWSSSTIDITLEILLPTIPSKTYFSQVIELKESQELYRTRYYHSYTGGNVIELIIWFNLRPEITGKVYIYLDEIELCPVDTCPYIPDIENATSTLLTTISTQIDQVNTTSAEHIKPLQEIPVGILFAVSILIVSIASFLVLKQRKRF